MCSHRIRFTDGAPGDEEEDEEMDALQEIVLNTMIYFPGSEPEAEEDEEIEDESPVGEHTGTYVRAVVFLFVLYQFVISYLMA